MKKQRALVIAVIAALAVFTVYNLPFIYMPLYTHTLNVKSGVTIVVVSDLHLEYNPKNLTIIGKLLQNLNASLLIINGDLFDEKKHEALSQQMLEHAFKRLGLDQLHNQELKVVYILALCNHDPYIASQTAFFEIHGIPVAVIKGALKLITPQNTLLLMHGDYIIGGGYLAGALNMITHSLAFEGLGKIVLHLADDSWLILGHSHVAGIDHCNRLANTGAWLDRIIAGSNTALVISVSDGGVDLKLLSFKNSCWQTFSQ